MNPDLAAESVADHEHVYRCQDCGEIGRAPSPDAYAEGYQRGKESSKANAYAKGYQDAFNEIGGRITSLFRRLPVPAYPGDDAWVWGHDCPPDRN